MIGGLVSGLLGQRAERKATSIDALLAPVFSLMSGAGVRVNFDTALRATAVLCCARVLAEGVAQIPLKLYRLAQDGGRALAKDHPLFRLLYLRPNEWQTAFEFREALMYHAVLTGNGVAFKNRVRGQLRELVPLIPGRVTVEQQPDYSLLYKVVDGAGKVITLTRDDVFHLRGPSWNTWLGMDVVRLAREAIGLSLATEESHAKLHKNGTQLSGLLSTDNMLSEEAKKSLREAWAEFQGSHNVGRTAVLDAGFKFTSMQMTGVDAQHIETRRFQIEEICRAMRVFPQMVMSSDKTSTYASAEQFFLAHVVHSLGPWLERWEEAIARDLLTDKEIEQGYFARFNVTALLRGDAKTRADFYSRGILDGWLVRNEVRELEELNPLPGLDDPLRPLNMTPSAGRGVPDAPLPPDQPPPKPQDAAS